MLIQIHSEDKTLKIEWLITCLANNCIRSLSEVWFLCVSNTMHVVKIETTTIRTKIVRFRNPRRYKWGPCPSRMWHPFTEWLVPTFCNTTCSSRINMSSKISLDISTLEYVTASFPLFYPKAMVGWERRMWKLRPKGKSWVRSNTRELKLKYTATQDDV